MIHLSLRAVLLVSMIAALVGCTRYRDDVDYEHLVEYTWQDSATAEEFTLFEGVVWRPSIAESIRSVVFETTLVEGRTVLVLYSGPGVVAVTCATKEAKRVVALAESDAAYACSHYNVVASEQDSLVKVMKISNAEVRVAPVAEKFDVILATLASVSHQEAVEELKNEPANALREIDERIALLLQCLDQNLEISGRVFAFCTDDRMVDRLKELCDAKGFEVVSGSTAPTLDPVVEIKPKVKNLQSPP